MGTKKGNMLSVYGRSAAPDSHGRRANDFAIVANGGTPSVDTSGALPVGPVRLMVGAAPYSATGGTNCCEAIS